MPRTCTVDALTRSYAVWLLHQLRQYYEYYGQTRAAGNAQETAEPIDDFSVQNLGVQLRYRFELSNAAEKRHRLRFIAHKSTGVKIQFEYDGKNRLRQIIDSGGRFIRFVNWLRERV